MKKYISHPGSLLLIGVLIYPLLLNIVMANKVLDILLHDTYGINVRLDVYGVVLLLTGAVSYLLHLLIVNMQAGIRAARVIQVLVSLILLILIYVHIGNITNDINNLLSIQVRVQMYTSLFAIVQVCWWLIAVVTIIRKKHKV